MAAEEPAPAGTALHAAGDASRWSSLTDGFTPTLHGALVSEGEAPTSAADSSFTMTASAGGGAPTGASPMTGTGILDAMKARGEATLDDCYALALLRNERIGAAREDYIQAKLLKTAARSAIIPQIALEDTYYQQNNVTLVSGGSGAPPTQQSNAFTTSDQRNELLVSLRQPLFHGLKDLNYMKFADQNIQSYRYALDDAGRQLYIDVALAFYTVLRAEAEVKALHETVTVERARLQEITARRDVGLARKTDVLLSQAQLSGNESQLTAAQNQTVLARQRLEFLTATDIDLPLLDETGDPKSLMGESGAATGTISERATAGGAAPGGDSEGAASNGSAPDASERATAGGAAPNSAPGGAAAPGSGAPSPTATPDAGVSAEWLEAVSQEALVQRSDLKQLDSNVEAARHKVSVAKGSYAPSIDLEADYILDRWNYAPFQAQTDWTAEITATFPIFTGGRIRSEVATEQSKLRQVAYDREQTARQIVLQVKDTWYTLVSDVAQIRTLEARVATAEENYRLIQEEYRNGLATNLEVLASQNELLSGRIDLERQRYQGKLDWLGFEVARGRRPEEPVPVEPPGARSAAQPADGTVQDGGTRQ